jgi:putative endopeptidase
MALDLSEFDAGIRVQDDLFRHVNGPWLRTAPIAPDRATAGAFITLVDDAEKAVRTIIEGCAAGRYEGVEARKIGDLYTSFMDEERVEAQGAAPLADDLARVDAVDSVAGLVEALGDLERRGVHGMFGLYVGVDRGRPDRYLVHAWQGGLGLPDESYYSDEDFASIREAYVPHVATMLALAGIDDAEARAARIVDLEARVAGFHWDRVTNRDTHKTYNLLAFEEAQALIPAFNLRTWSERWQVPAGTLDEVIIGQPSFFEGLNSLLTPDNLTAWTDWLRWQLIHAAAPYLSSAFVEANFAFYGKTLQGTEELRPRWKRGVSFVESAMGEAVGKLYVAEHYPPEARARMDELIERLLEAYRVSIRELAWMSPDTKERALAKLDSFTPKVGHPEEFKDYSALEVDAGDVVGNARRSLNVEMDRELGKLGRPIDRGEWFMTPQTVNAYYNPTMNEIVFPAAILQPPFFDAGADDAVNYGAIGAVIGHEIGHGFDDQGSQFDGTGALNNWWTDDDRAAFEKLASELIEQYNGLSPEGTDGHVNGALTIGENIGDLGGLGIAYRAFRFTEPDDLPVDGLTPHQRFFLSWAQAWRAKVRPEETQRRLAIDPHSPPEFRCNQVVRNLDAFHAAFGVDAHDGLWLEPERRVTIWAS